MSQSSSETAPKAGIRALIAYIATSFILDPATKDKLTQQIVGFGRALMFMPFRDGDPVKLYEAYAAKVTEFGIPKVDSMVDSIREHCVQARETWLETRFASWTKKLGKVGLMDHDDAISVIQDVGTEIIELTPADLIIVLKEHERHGLAALVRGTTLVHQFEGSPQLAAKIDAHLGVITIVEPTSQVLQQHGANGADKGTDVEVGTRVAANEPTANAA